MPKERPPAPTAGPAERAASGGRRALPSAALVSAARTLAAST